MSNDAQTILNASGFLFQLRVEQEVQSNGARHSWSVAAREHPWSHERSGRTGFVDLILEAGPFRLVVECKRSRKAQWFFVVPNDAKPIVRRTTVYWIQDVPKRGQRLGWGSLQLVPPTYESAFCILRGSGENDLPLIERLGSLLVDSTEAVGREEVLHQRGTGCINWLVYAPVIVTNAKLLAARCDLSAVSLESGEIGAVETEEVPYVRFRKALSHRFPWPSRVADLRAISESRQRTLFVVNASALTQFLETFNHAKSLEAYPWVIAEQTNAPVTDELWL